MEEFAIIVGYSFMVGCSLASLFALVYALSEFVIKVSLRKAHDAYRSVSVLYYMGVCYKNGRKGLKEEAEKAKNED